MPSTKFFQFGAILGLTYLLAISASSTYDATEGCSPSADDESDKVLFMQLPPSSNHIDLSKRSKTMLHASVLHALSKTDFGRHVSTEDLKNALDLASATSHEKENGNLPNFSFMGYEISATNPQISAFNATKPPEVTFNDTTNTVHLSLTFSSEGSITLNVKTPPLPHWDWGCWCFKEKETPDMSGQMSIHYAGDFTFSAKVLIVDQKPTFEITHSSIARLPGGCDLNGDSTLGFILNMAEEPLCNALEGGANTALRTAALAVSNAINEAIDHFTKLLKLLNKTAAP